MKAGDTLSKIAREQLGTRTPTWRSSTRTTISLGSGQDQPRASSEDSAAFTQVDGAAQPRAGPLDASLHEPAACCRYVAARNGQRDERHQHGNRHQLEERCAAAVGERPWTCIAAEDGARAADGDGRPYAGLARTMVG